MKHNRLHSVAHNFADSMSSGLGFVVGHCMTDVFSDAAANGEIGVIVDFLSGEIFAKNCSDELSDCVPQFHKAFPKFCEKHSVDVLDFRMFRVRFVSEQLYNYYLVTIEDSRGKCSTRVYYGFPNVGKRVKQNDRLRAFHRPKIWQTPDKETLECKSYIKLWQNPLQMALIWKKILKRLRTLVQ